MNEIPSADDTRKSSTEFSLLQKSPEHFPKLLSERQCLSLPIPTYVPTDPSKKTHARRQPEGYVRRPRNPFILFRCDFVRQQKVPKDVESDHRNLSRIAGIVWNGMSDKEKEPWIRMAETEKTEHTKTYPWYRYSPTAVRRKPKRGNETPVSVERSRLPCDISVSVPPRRSSSCPPGAQRISQAFFENSNPYGRPVVTRDDLARRPSRVIMYQSTSQTPPTAEPESLSGVRYLPSLQLSSGPYRIEDPCDAPGWDAVAPTPLEWAHNSRPDIFNLGSSSGLVNAGPSQEHPIYSNPPDIPPLFTNPFLSSLPPLPANQHPLIEVDSFLQALKREERNSRVLPTGPPRRPFHIRPDSFPSHYTARRERDLSNMMPRLSISDRAETGMRPDLQER